MDIIFKNSKKAKSIRISIQPGGLVTVTKPYFLPKLLANKFVEQKRVWLEQTIQKQKEVKSLKSDREEYLKHKDEARRLILAKIKELNSFYGFSFKRVSIKNQRTRWGSCSSLGNLSFNWQVSRLSSDLTEYIIVHELCHLREMNHSKKFWSLVSTKIPNYKILRKRLIKNGINLI